MLDPLATAERHARILGRLAELGMAMAEDVAKDAATAETPAARAEAAKTFHTLSRSIRQSLALEARVVRDAGRDQAEADAKMATEAEHAVERRRTARRAEARQALDRLVWTEWDMPPTDGLRFCHEMGRAIDRADLSEDEPIEAQILRLMDALGYEIRTTEAEVEGDVAGDDAPPSPATGERTAEPGQDGLVGSDAPDDSASAAEAPGAVGPVAQSPDAPATQAEPHPPPTPPPEPYLMPWERGLRIGGGSGW